MADKEKFRDSVSTIDKEGKRVWVFPRMPKGKLYRWRTAVSVFLLALLFGIPFIKINGQPLLLLNILERKFVVFGMPFWPQDFYIFMVATLTIVVFVVLFTVVFGRIWCGWACPQTIFMEMVFRRIEYLIEGDAREQRRLNEAPMSAEKFFKKTLKHGIFFALSVILANTFLAYIIGIDELKELITSSPAEHLTGFIVMLLFSAVFYWIYAFFREQICTMVCPYGRLQGVLLDKKTIVVAYDFLRGEPRGKSKKAESTGDCIDCNMCVDVCPTGIDIRNGTQLECVNCTACIDACNSVMDKVKKPRGLIRYDSYEGIEKGTKLTLSARIVGYSAILLILLTALILLFTNRSVLDATVLRTPGVLFQELPDGRLSNLYNIKVVNKTFDEKPIELKMLSPVGEIEIIGGSLTAPPGSLCESSFFIKLDKKFVPFRVTPVVIAVMSEGVVLEEIKSSFLGPAHQKGRLDR